MNDATIPAENVANGLTLDGSVTYEVKIPTKRKRYGRLVCCADCGFSSKTLYKIGDLYYCRDCKKNHM